MISTRAGQLLSNGSVVVMPGVYDTLSTLIIRQTGFPIGFVSGYSVAASAIGEPDFGLLTQTEMLERSRQICGCIDIPVIVDADTGYGNPLNVMRTVDDLIRAGAAGCFLEDQVWPKKCGHMRGKKVIDRDEYLHKIRSAFEARDGRDFFIVARTDALAAVGMDEALARMDGAQAAGADASFVEAPGTGDHMAEIGRRAPKPIVANMIEGGKTPVMARDELGALGFQLIVYPLCGLFAAARAMRSVYGTLHADQTTLNGLDHMLQFDEFNDLIGVDRRYADTERFSGPISGG
ncbi:MAG: carboxyvinyl-carboxyphosphonate phosphorylmutase [Phycisphaeraceae bacterium]|nr:carboxyvinyl-carboxyphosphonate phosphorylmutase [Phycisphaeraceae bacterium]